MHELDSEACQDAATEYNECAAEAAAAGYSEENYWQYGCCIHGPIDSQEACYECIGPIGYSCSCCSFTCYNATIASTPGSQPEDYLKGCSDELNSTQICIDTYGPGFVLNY